MYDHLEDPFSPLVLGLGKDSGEKRFSTTKSWGPKVFNIHLSKDQLDNQTSMKWDLKGPMSMPLDVHTDRTRHAKLRDTLNQQTKKTE